MDLLAHMLASGGDDNSLKLWFWLIVGVIFLIKKVIELLKPDAKDEEPPVPDTENHHEKRVKEVIAEMRRTNPQPRQIRPNQSAAPSRAPRTSASSVELPSPAVPRKPRQSPAPEATQPVETDRQTAQNVLERYVKATEEARQSMRSLSDAEQEALQRLQKREMKEHQTGSLPSSAVVESPSLKNSLRHPKALKAAVLYQEILGKPRALRSPSFSGK